MLVAIIAGSLFVLILTLGLAWEHRKDTARRDEDIAAIQGLIDDLDEDDAPPAVEGEGGVAMPKSIKRAAGRITGSGFFSRGGREDLVQLLDRQLMYSGMNNPVEPRRPLSGADAMSYYMVYAGAVILGTIVLFMVLSFPPLFVFMWMLGLLWFPWRLLKQKVRKRQEGALLQVDKFLDELDLVLSNGRTSLDDAIGYTIHSQLSQRRRDPILAREFDYAFRQWTAGRSQSEALRDISHRVGVFQLTAVIENMIQNLEKGTDPREVVQNQSHQAKVMFANMMRTEIKSADTAFSIAMMLSLMGVTIIILGSLLITIVGTGGMF